MSEATEIVTVTADATAVDSVTSDVTVTTTVTSSVTAGGLNVSSVQNLTQLQAAIDAGWRVIEIGADIDLTNLAAPLEVPAVTTIYSKGGYTLSNCTQASIFNCGATVTSLTIDNLSFTGNAHIVNIESEGTDMELHFCDCSGSANTDHILAADATSSVTMRKVTGLIAGNDFDLNRHHFILFDAVGLENIHVERNKLATARKSSIAFGQNDNFRLHRRGIWVCDNECSDVDDSYVSGSGNQEAHHIFVRSCMDVFIKNNKLSEVHTQEAGDNRTDNEAIYTKSSRAVIDGNVIHNGGYTSIAFKGNQEEITDSLIAGWDEATGALVTPGDRSIITNNIITYSDDYITARGNDHKGSFLDISGSLLVCNNSYYDVSYGIDLKQNTNGETDNPHIPGTVVLKDNYFNGCSGRGIWVRPGAGFSHLSISGNKFVNQTSTGLLLRMTVDSVIDVFDWNILGNEISGTPTAKMGNGINVQFDNQATTPQTFDGLLMANNVIKYATNGITRSGVEPINLEPSSVITNIDVGEGRLETASVLGQNYFFDITTADYSGW